MSKTPVEIVVDDDSFLTDIGHGIVQADYCPNTLFRHGIKFHGFFLNENYWSIGVLAQGRQYHEGLSRRYIFGAPLNYYPVVSLYAHSGIYFTQPSPGLKYNPAWSLPNIGFAGLAHELPEKFMDKAAEKISREGEPIKNPFVVEDLYRHVKVRLVSSMVEKALRFGLLPPNSIFGVMKIGYDQWGEALQAEGYNVIFKQEDLLETWRELDHAFLTWQILNGLLRSCRFIGVAGAANLFSLVPIECLYLYEYSDRFIPESVDIRGKWQEGIFGSKPIFDTPDRAELREESERLKKPPHSGPFAGYRFRRKYEEILTAVRRNPGRPEIISLPPCLDKFRK